MRNYLKISLLFLPLLLCISTSYSQDDVRSRFPSVIFTESEFTPGDSCAVVNPERHDDFTHENGYRQTAQDSTRFVIKMTPSTLPWIYTSVCIGWTKTAAGTGTLNYDIVVYDTLGAGGSPGSLLAVFPGQTITGIPNFPLMIWNSSVVSIPVSASLKAVYIGARVNFTTQLSVFMSADQTPPIWPGYLANGSPPAWQTIQTIFTGYTCMCIRTEGMPAAPPYYPNVLYYKFENNPGPLLTPNCAIPPAGTNPAPITGHTITSGGQFDSCLSGTGGTGAVQTGWNCNLAAGNWTISFWVSNLLDLNPTYLFGDVGSTSFRCFYGGAALPNNILFRGPMTDILIPCPMPGNQVFHFVYNGTNVIIYRNGVLVSTNPRAINMPTGTGFRVGGYNNVASSMSGKMDEFKIVRYAMTPAEITATWNSDLGGCGLVGITTNNNQIPAEYTLSQNYPNPFNPTTNIKFSIPNAGNVKLVIFDILGREVTTLVNEFRTAGNYLVDFDASNLASGVYFYTLKSNDFSQTKKMLLVK